MCQVMDIWQPVFLKIWPRNGVVISDKFLAVISNKYVAVISNKYVADISDSDPKIYEWIMAVCVKQPLAKPVGRLNIEEKGTKEAIFKYDFLDIQDYRKPCANIIIE